MLLFLEKFKCMEFMECGWIIKMNFTLQYTTIEIIFKIILNYMDKSKITNDLDRAGSNADL
jgi:hypothetical protein